jgi:hypothetical protein
MPSTPPLGAGALLAGRGAADLTHLQRLDGYGHGVARSSFTEQSLDSTGIFKDAVISIMTTIGKQE